MGSYYIYVCMYSFWLYTYMHIFSYFPFRLQNRLSGRRMIVVVCLQQERTAFYWRFFFLSFCQWHTYKRFGSIFYAGSFSVRDTFNLLRIVVLFLELYKISPSLTTSDASKNSSSMPQFFKELNASSIRSLIFAIFFSVVRQMFGVSSVYADQANEKFSKC